MVRRRSRGAAETYAVVLFCGEMNRRPRASGGAESLCEIFQRGRFTLHLSERRLQRAGQGYFALARSTKQAQSCSGSFGG